MTHAHAAAADWLALAERAPTRRGAAGRDDRADRASGLGHAGRAALSLCRGRRSAGTRTRFSPPSKPKTKPRAIALIARRAARRHCRTRNLRPRFGRAALSHYADFGHSAIYALQDRPADRAAGRRCGGAGAAGAGALADQRARARSGCRNFAATPRRWPRGTARAMNAGARGGFHRPFHRCRTEAHARVVGRGRRANSTMRCSARRRGICCISIWRSTRRPTIAIADNVSWLDFTHALTFANAARHICEEQPDLWPHALLQMALFVGRNKGYVNAQQDVGALARERHRAASSQSEMARLYDHGIVEPIIACHRVKMLFALEDELAAAPDAPWDGHGGRDEPLAAHAAEAPSRPAPRDAGARLHRAGEVMKCGCYCGPAVSLRSPVARCALGRYY